jgi:hypothetical protein
MATDTTTPRIRRLMAMTGSAGAAEAAESSQAVFPPAAIPRSRDWRPSHRPAARSGLPDTSRCAGRAG